MGRDKSGFPAGIDDRHAIAWTLTRRCTATTAIATDELQLTRDPQRSPRLRSDWAPVPESGVIAG